jgi:biopolymer transport protein ExbB
MGSDRIVRSLLAVALVMVCLGAYGQAPAPAPEATPTAAPAPAAAAPAADTPAPVPATKAPTITLWWMLEKGGLINWLILAMSVVGVVMAVYLLLTLTPSREVPQQLVKRAQTQIRAGDLRGAYEMCEGRDELFARVLEAGLRMSGRDRYLIQEAMESEGERGATALWQRISYLNNIGAIAPLMGLLGTVWGMIRAFSGIAFENSAAKGLVMAEGVAQAMITTACGLMLAIPALLVYYYLRGRVIKIIAEVEAEASEIIELLARREA